MILLYHSPSQRCETRDEGGVGRVDGEELTVPDQWNGLLAFHFK